MTAKGPEADTLMSVFKQLAALTRAGKSVRKTALWKTLNHQQQFAYFQYLDAQGIIASPPASPDEADSPLLQSDTFTVTFHMPNRELNKPTPLAARTPVSLPKLVRSAS